MSPLVLAPDACGRRGQLSLMADYFEWCAWIRAPEITPRAISDYLSDRQLSIPRFRSAPLHESDTTAEIELPLSATDHTVRADARRIQANEDADRLFSLFAERRQYLGHRYPYESTGARLRRSKPSVTAYDVALATTLAHSCFGDARVAYEFEDFVARCLLARRFKTFAMARAIRGVRGRGAARFRKVYTRLATALSLARDGNAQIPEQIHDGGADVVARWEPFDDRPGCRTLLIQVTVTHLDNWACKAMQRERMWSRILGDPIQPLVTLAVPHHVERDYLHGFVEEWHGASILDRLRLVAHSPSVTPKERVRVMELRARGVEW